MGNKTPSSKLSECGDCHKVVGTLLGPLENKTCRSAAIGSEIVCQTAAAANIVDGLDVMLEPICDVLPVAFTFGCDKAEKSKTPNKWVNYVTDKTCQPMCH